MKNFIVGLLMVFGLVGAVVSTHQVASAQGFIPAQNGHVSWSTYAAALADTQSQNESCYRAFLNEACASRGDCYSYKHSAISANADAYDRILSMPDGAAKTQALATYNEINSRITTYGEFSSLNAEFSDAVSLMEQGDNYYGWGKELANNSQACLDYMSTAYNYYKSAWSLFLVNDTHWETRAVKLLAAANDAATLRDSLPDPNPM